MTQVNIDIENENLFFTQKRWAHDNFMGTVLKVKEGHDGAGLNRQLGI